jgi:DNA-binding beta-propeller fold protein YncE
MRIVGRYRVAGGKFPHGLLIDPDRRLAFIACEQDAKLLTVDLRTMNVTGINQVGDDPDVLAFDPVWRRLYVASESGVVSVFDERNRSLRPIGEIRAPNAHSVAVDPASHRIYLPLKNVHGQPVLRIIDIRPPIAAAPSQ